jgi:hypothetical protein
MKYHHGEYCVVCWSVNEGSGPLECCTTLTVKQLLMLRMSIALSCAGSNNPSAGLVEALHLSKTSVLPVDMALHPIKII